MPVNLVGCDVEEGGQPLTTQNLTGMLKHYAEHLSLLAAEPEHFAAPPDHRCLGVYSVGANTQCFHRWQQGDALTLRAW